MRCTSAFLTPAKKRPKSEHSMLEELTEAVNETTELMTKKTRMKGVQNNRAAAIERVGVNQASDEDSMLLHYAAERLKKEKDGKWTQMTYK